MSRFSLSTRALEHLRARPETARFFRQAKGLQALAAAIRAKPSKSFGGRYRVWVTSGSTGDDAYSTAMAVRDALAVTSPGCSLHMLATGRSPEAVQKARRAFYDTDSVLRQVSIDHQERNFNRVAGGFRIENNLRKLCQFAVHDLAEDLPFVKLDAIVCPMPLKRVSDAARRRLMDLFHFSLKPGGLLLLGPRSVPPHSLLFQRLRFDSNLYTKPGAPVGARGEDLRTMLRKAADYLKSEWRGFEGYSRGGSLEKQEQFVAMVSHELRTPLASIIGYTETLQRGVRAARERRAFLSTIEKNARRLMTTVESLIDVGDLQRRRRPEAVHLEPILRAAAAAFAKQAKAGSVTIDVDVTPSVRVTADSADLPHVFENLLGNAVKFNKKGGKVSVSCVRDGSDVLIEVADTGIGIFPDSVDRVFDRFYRCPSARGVKGSGLGLSIVRSLVEANGGRVSVDSVHGRGSTFQVRLPAA